MPAKTQAPLGSMPWIQAEKENVVQLLEQEKEELVYPAQHEVEWLNEHMAEIFSTSQFNVTDVFKTPGKLRGKTPRTARKRQVPDARIPLSDVFSSKPHHLTSPRAAPGSGTKRAKFVIAQDPESEPAAQNTGNVPAKYTDSGYHGSQEDEMEVDTAKETPPEPTLPETQHDSAVVTTQTSTRLDSVERSATEGSFHSAKEDVTVKTAVPQSEDMEVDTDAAVAANEEAEPEAEAEVKAQQQAAKPLPVKAHFAHDLEDIGSPSDGLTPDRPLVRKSSLNFASLPAREPLNSKMSLGVRASQIDLDQPRTVTESQVDRVMDDAPAEIESYRSHTAEKALAQMDEDRMATEHHHKSTTQRLQEKIDMLGKSQASRASKSIPSAAALAALNLRKSEAASKAAKEAAEPEQVNNEIMQEDDDWIKPLGEPERQPRPVLTKSYTADVTENVLSSDIEEDGDDDEANWEVKAPELVAHQERMRTPSASTVTLASPGKEAMAFGLSPGKTASVSHIPTTTPKGSPHRYFNAPLSASKSKLQSIMKTAKGLFSSSAGISAAAKMETMSPNHNRLAGKMPGLYPSIMDVTDGKPLPPSPPKEGRRTRSSTEREKEERRRERETKERSAAEEQLNKAREKQKQKVTSVKVDEPSRTQSALRKSPRRAAEDAQDVEKVDDGAGPAVPGKTQRPIKTTRVPPKKNPPQPMSIRLGSTLSQRMPMNNSTIASNLHESQGPSVSRPAAPSKKTSTLGTHPGFSRSTSTQVGKPRALLAAERKKEADEKEAQRKLEQKRETERKRAAQQEEGRRAEQRQRAEIERRERDRLAQEQAKKQAQQQAIDKRRQEQAKKAEQQRIASAQEQASSSSTEGPPRPPSRLVSRQLMNHNLPTNPAKPPKRQYEDEAGPSRPQASKYGGAAQQTDAKRRRTEDEEVLAEPAARPTISGAPVRQSNMMKKPTVFPLGYGPAPAVNGAQVGGHTFPQPPSGQYRAPQHQQADTSKYAAGNKIPFADAPNPPPAAPAHRTPNSHLKSTLALVKSSPQYTPGETIALPEIPTDSEDEDDDSQASPSFPVPSWASPNTLTNQLLAQESVDGDAVFGPIAPLRMEEIFAKGNKDRLKRFRDRTSSANWATSGDGLTEKEVREDREMRERMRTMGGWRYGVS